jgi:hypothetical protein
MSPRLSYAASSDPTREGAMAPRLIKVEPFDLVVFGAAGNEEFQ